MEEGIVEFSVSTTHGDSSLLMNTVVSLKLLLSPKDFLAGDH